MSKGKRIGYGVLSLLPLLFMLLIQVLGGQIIYAAVTVYMSMQPGMDPAMLNDIVYTYVMEHYTGILLLIQGVTLLVFGCWYYLGFTRKKERGSAKNLLHIHNLAGIFLLSAGIYFFVTLFLVAADHLVPDIMDEYNMLMLSLIHIFPSPPGLALPCGAAPCKDFCKGRYKHVGP